METQVNSCFVVKPTTQSIRFAGRFVNLTVIADVTEINHSYLSRIFSGERNPSMKYIRKIARALDMGVEEFLDALDSRVRTLRVRAMAS